VIKRQDTANAAERATVALNIPPDARDIARMVTMPEVLRHLGWRIRHRNRADCGLCRGTSTGTVAFTERLWRCHRCNEGGDVFSLARAVNHCDFPEALRHVAELAGIRLEDAKGVNVRREVASRKQRRERVENAADKLEALERTSRLECRDRIHLAESRLAKLSDATAWAERDWLTASVCWTSLRRDLATYTLLSFADPAERARFVLHPELREEIISGVRWAGCVRTADGKRMEVLA
jgi:CHC2 zinc finger